MRVWDEDKKRKPLSRITWDKGFSVRT